MTTSAAAPDGDSLYDRDIYAWAERQADVLRRLATSRGFTPAELDFERIAEEIEQVGRAELSRAESFLRLMLLHILKLASAPDCRSARHWIAEIRVFQSDLQRSLTPSIAARAQIERAWRLARMQAFAQLEAEGDRLLAGLPARCPFSILELAAETFDLDAAVARLFDPDAAVARLRDLDAAVARLFDPDAAVARLRG